MRAAFSDALVSAAVEDPSVLLLTGDHGYALFDAFRKARPAQYINCGIAEQNMVGVAAGLARGGFKPIVYGLAAFVPTRVLEQMKMDVCYENLPVIFIGDGAGFVYSHLGASHQCTEDIACTRALPGLTVLSPADRFEMAATMRLAREMASPVYIRVGKSDRGDVHSAALSLRPGQMVKLTAGRERVAILATGSMVKTAQALVGEGLQAQVWSVPSIKPFDEDTLAGLCQEVDKLVVLEEHSVYGGLGARIAESVSQSHATALCCIGVQDRFSTYCGSYEYLLTEHGLDLASVRRRVHDFIASAPRQQV